MSETKDRKKIGKLLAKAHLILYQMQSEGKIFKNKTITWAIEIYKKYDPVYYKFFFVDHAEALS